MCCTEEEAADPHHQPDSVDIYNLFPIWAEREKQQAIKDDHKAKADQLLVQENNNKPLFDKNVKSHYSQLQLPSSFFSLIFILTF